MVTPTISHETWLKVDAWTDVLILHALDDSYATEYSFEDKLELLLDTEPADTKRDMDTDQYDYSSKMHPDGMIRYYWVPDRLEDHIHRPQVSDECAQQLEEWVELNSVGPASAYDFEEQVKLFLDSIKEWQSILDVYVKKADMDTYFANLTEEKKQYVLKKVRDMKNTKQQKEVASVVIAKHGN